MNFSTVSLRNANGTQYKTENYFVDPLRQAEGDGFHYAAKTNKQLIADCYASGGSPIVSGGGLFVKCDSVKIAPRVNTAMMGADGFYNADGTLMVADVAKHYNVTLEQVSGKYGVPVSTLKNATLNDISVKAHVSTDTVVKQISELSPTGSTTAPNNSPLNSFLNLISLIPKGDTISPAPAPAVTATTTDNTTDDGKIWGMNKWIVIGGGTAVVGTLLFLLIRKLKK